MAGVHTSSYEADQEGDCHNIDPHICRKKTIAFDELKNTERDKERERQRDRGRQREHETKLKSQSFMYTNCTHRVKLAFSSRTA